MSAFTMGLRVASVIKAVRELSSKEGLKGISSVATVLFSCASGVVVVGSIGGSAAV